MTNTKNVTVEFDYFESKEFEQELNSIQPFAQLINPTVIQSKRKLQLFGLGITEDNVENAGLTLGDEWELEDHHFKKMTDGKDEKKLTDEEKYSVVNTYISKAPRLVIVHRSKLYMQHSKTKQIIPFNKIEYDKLKINKNKEVFYKTFSEAFIFILNSKNELCHRIEEDDQGIFATPLKLKLSGVAGTRFGAKFLSINNYKRSGFCFEMEKAYSEYKSLTKPKPMSSLFHAHLVYEPLFDVGVAGSGNDTSEIAEVKKHGYGALIVPSDIKIPGITTAVNPELIQVIKRAYEDFKDYQPRLSEVEDQNLFPVVSTNSAFEQTPEEIAKNITSQGDAVRWAANTAGLNEEQTLSLIQKAKEQGGTDPLKPRVLFVEYVLAEKQKISAPVANNMIEDPTTTQDDLGAF